MVLEHLDIFTAEPDNNLLHEREDDEAYVAAVPGKQYGRDDGGEMMGTQGEMMGTQYFAPRSTQNGESS